MQVEAFDDAQASIVRRELDGQPIDVNRCLARVPRCSSHHAR
jgi:hypothetical protein